MMVDLLSPGQVRTRRIVLVSLLLVTVAVAVFWTWYILLLGVIGGVTSAVAKRGRNYDQWRQVLGMRPHHDPPS